MATTTNYSWTTPDNTAYVKDGASAIRTLGSSVDTTLFTALGGTYPGLRFVKKQTVGTAVSSVSVTNAFSATYENYRIIYTGGTGSASGEINFALNGITTGYYSSLLYTTGTTPLAASQTNVSSWFWCGGTNGTNIAEMELTITSPFATKWKTMTSALRVAVLGTTQGYLVSTTSATGFTITPTASTLTGGTIYVYGYGIS
jgi:hypothetical protein